MGPISSPHHKILITPFQTKNRQKITKKQKKIDNNIPPLPHPPPQVPSHPPALLPIRRRTGGISADGRAGEAAEGARGWG